MKFMTYTLNEHLNSFPIADDKIYLLVNISASDALANSKCIGRWFKSNLSTRFRYLINKLQDKRNELNLGQLKTLYPNVTFIGIIDNPWHHLYHIHNTHPTFSKMSLTHFIKLVSVRPRYRCNLLDLYPPDSSIIFLRNEYIANDFSIFSKSSNVLFPDQDIVDYRKFFDAESNNIICSIFQKDIEFFYPELLS